MLVLRPLSRIRSRVMWALILQAVSFHVFPYSRSFPCRPVCALRTTVSGRSSILFTSSGNEVWERSSTTFCYSSRIQAPVHHTSTTHKVALHRSRGGACRKIDPDPKDKATPWHCTLAAQASFSSHFLSARVSSVPVLHLHSQVEIHCKTQAKYRCGRGGWTENRRVFLCTFMIPVCRLILRCQYQRLLPHAC